jgi:hypothetical protein
MASDSVYRFLGGSPGAVILRLIILSLVVGVILNALDLSPFDIVNSLGRFARRIYDMGFDAFEGLIRYFVLGAVIVIPIWLLIRVLKYGRNQA